MKHLHLRWMSENGAEIYEQFGIFLMSEQTEAQDRAKAVAQYLFSARLMLVTCDCVLFDVVWKGETA